MTIKFNRSWSDNKDKGYRKQNYVPLSERKDWDGKVEKLPTKKPPAKNGGQRD